MKCNALKMNFDHLNDCLVCGNALCFVEFCNVFKYFGVKNLGTILLNKWLSAVNPG